MANQDATQSWGKRRHVHGSMGMFGQFIGLMAAWNEARATRSALARLTDQELDDVGLTRGDIDRVARTRRY